MRLYDAHLLGLPDRVGSGLEEIPVLGVGYTGKLNIGRELFPENGNPDDVGNLRYLSPIFGNNLGF